MSSAGKKIVDSLTFLLFKEKKMFSSTPPSSTNFSLFLKNGKNAKLNLLFKKMHVLSKKKQKQKLIEQKHPKIYISMQTKSS